MANTGMTSTNVDDLMQIALVEAQMTINQGFNLRDFVTRRPVKNGKTVRFPRYANLSAVSLTEGTPITTAADITTSSVDVTASEVGQMTIISDVVGNAYAQAAADAGKLLGNAITAKINQDIWGLFDGFSTVYSDSSSAGISEAYIEAAYESLLIANAPKPYFIAVTPKVYGQLLSLYSTNTSITADGYKNTVLGSGVVPPIYGMPVLQITDLTSEVLTAETAKCGVFSQAAIGYADGWDIKIEVERSAAHRGYRLVGTAFYGVAEINDDWGVELEITQ